MRKPDREHVSSIILGVLVFLVVSGAYAAMFLVVRRSSESLNGIQTAFRACHDRIQDQQLAELHSGVLEEASAVDIEGMDTAVRRFRELSAILWKPRNDSSGIVMDIVWNDWKRARNTHPLPQYESRQLLQALRNAGVQLGDLNRSTRDAFDLVIFLSGLLFSIGTAGSIAFYARLQKSRLKEEFAAENLKKALESEDGIRKTIAMELHDDIAQDIAAARMLCERARDMGGDAPGLVQRAALTLGEVNQKIRILCATLRPPALEELGLHEALKVLCDADSARQAKSLTYLPETEIPRLPGQVEGNLYRIVREAVMNASKHSRAGDAEVRSWIARADKDRRELILEVRDFGYDETSRTRQQGFGLGLTSMKERAEQIGADLVIRLDPGGSSVRVMLPLESDNRKEQR